MAREPTAMPLLAALLIATAIAAAAPRQAPPTAYGLEYASPGGATVRVTLRLPGPLAEGGVFVMPRAVPMGYGEQRYDAFVSGLAAATAGGAAVAVTRQEGPRWRLDAGVATIAYSVDVRRMEAEVLSASDASKAREGYLGLLGYSVFGYVEGLEDRPVTLDISGPAGWPVISTLAPDAATSRLATRAPHFYALADSQIAMGPRVSVTAIPGASVPLRLLIYAEAPVDTARVAKAAETAFNRVSRYFGDVPFTHYTILQEVLTPLSPRHRYNFSMEHLDSMTSSMAADRALTPRSPPDDDARAQFNFAHHIAHAWVPKRAAGAGYFPFQWELAPLIDTIWFAEGFGQYAAIMALAAGEPDPAGYRERLIERRFRQTLREAPPFLRRLSLVDLSRVASTRYAEDFRTGQLVFSRGGLLAAELDSLVQLETGGRKSLADLLRALAARQAATGRGFTVDEFPAIVRAATGVDASAMVRAALEPLDR
jgi:predicted metalloprotease with PDZ domain